MVSGSYNDVFDSLEGISHLNGSAESQVLCISGLQAAGYTFRRFLFPWSKKTYEVPRYKYYIEAGLQRKINNFITISRQNREASGYSQIHYIYILCQVNNINIFIIIYII